MSTSSSSEQQRFRLGDWWVLPDRNQLKGEFGNETLEPRMMDVLSYLCQHQGEVVSSEQLLIAVWQGRFFGDAPVQKCIAGLRKKLGCDARHPKYIETLPKRGYRIVAPISSESGVLSTTHSNAEPWTSGSPYLGLASFEEQHTGVFFGRTQAIAEVVHALRELEPQGQGFLLVLGRSGVGKSSLLKAGLLPLLCQTGGFAGIELAQQHKLGARAAQSSHIALIRLLDALQKLGFIDKQDSAEALAKRLEKTPQSLQGWLKPNASKTKALLIDPLEQWLLEPSLSAHAQSQWVQWLQLLAKTRGLLLIGALRSDCYGACTDISGFIELKRSGVQYDVKAAAPGEIAQMIRAPAQAAGVGFEQDPHSGERLDDLLLEEAVSHPEALPLLQYTLAELFHRRQQGQPMLLSVYHQMGGVSGAVAQQAEAKYQGLDDKAKACWSRLMHQLVSYSSASGQASAQRLAMAKIGDDTSKKLVQQFVAARLFVVEQDERDQQQYLRIAHEALIRQWQRLRDWIQDNRTALAKHEWLQSDCQRWLNANRNREYLLRAQQQLADARWLKGREDIGLSDDELAFIDASLLRAKRIRWLRRSGVAALILLSVSTFSFAVVAWRGQQQASAAREDAEALAEFMLVDLRDQLEPIGKLSLLESVAQRLLSYYQGVSSSNAPARAEALKLSAEIDIGKGQYASAQSNLEQAQQLLEQFPVETLASDKRLLLAHVYYWRGLIPYYQGDLEQSKRWWLGYLERVESLQQYQPENSEWQYELAQAHHNLGALARRQQDIGSARYYLDQAVVHKRQLIASEPENLEYAQSLANSLNWQVTLESRYGDLAMARQIASEASTIAEFMLQQQPDDFDAKYKWLTAANITIGAYLDSGDIDGARYLYKQSHQTAEDLYQQDADNKSWQVQLALYQLRGLMLAHTQSDEHQRQHQQLAELLGQRPIDNRRWLRTYLRFQANNECVSHPRTQQDIQSLANWLMSERAEFLVDSSPALVFSLSMSADSELRNQLIDYLREQLPQPTGHNNLYLLLGHYYLASLERNRERAQELLQSIRARGYRHPQFERWLNADLGGDNE
ncbi:winged helix-turn-helix domain-containing protein [Paraferrimonas sedimenticola]|uniref:Transcriptional regulator n=1 Tax=Paraferrimonas sedimenticola TaxID=375674 RepID=A0AA37RS28_9GAMM|nr:winged helix-turn-helix domain-containing protein [Paraferrimonas sedimenticola]GLP95010.1 transcriptional regulator [Paraferrimonas sedimenticola]